MSAPDGARAKEALAALLDRARGAYEKGDAYADLLFEELAASASADLRAPLSFEDALSAYADAAALVNDLPRGFRFARAFADALEKKTGSLPQPEEYFSSFPEKMTVALPDDRYSARAFTLCPPGAEKCPLENCEGACEEVSEGERDACLLPYLDENGRPLPGISRLIEEYGLKKLSLILLSGEERSFGYVLLSRTLVFDGGADVLELTLYSGDAERVSDLCRLAEEEGLRVSPPAYPRRKETENDSGGVCTLRVSGGAEALRAFAFTARLLFPDGTVSGFYTLRETKL